MIEGIPVPRSKQYDMDLQRIANAECDRAERRANGIAEVRFTGGPKEFDGKMILHLHPHEFTNPLVLSRIRHDEKRSFLTRSNYRITEIHNRKTDNEYLVAVYMGEDQDKELACMETKE